MTGVVFAFVEDVDALVRTSAVDSIFNQPPQELANIRKGEFAASCNILQVSRPVILDYPDGQLYRQELNRVVYELTLHVRRFRPQVMLTFGAEGGVTGHPDHSMAGIFAAIAFHWAGRANRYSDQLHDGLAAHRTQKLYHSTAAFALPNRQPITFSPHTAVIDIGDHLETKIAAFKAHKTQAPLWPLFEENTRKRGRQELFHLAASVKSGAVKPETDLFDGVMETPLPDSELSATTLSPGCDKQG